MESVKLGPTDLEVSRVGFGGAPLGGLYGRKVSIADGVKAVHRALEVGINFFDTAPLYGEGMSEQIIGRALATWAGPTTPIIATKAGRWPPGFDYSHDATMASVEASLRRLGVDHLPLVHMHAVHLAPSVRHVLSPAGSLGALLRLKAEGVVDNIGVGTPDPIIAEYIASDAVDVALVANQYDLLDRSAAATI